MEMFEGDAADPVCACEQMMLHIDSSGAPKSASFDEDIAARIAAMPRGVAVETRYAW